MFKQTRRCIDTLECYIDRVIDKVKDLNDRLDSQLNIIGRTESDIELLKEKQEDIKSTLQKQMTCKHEDYCIVSDYVISNQDNNYKTEIRYRKECNQCGLVLERDITEERAKKLRVKYLEEKLERAKQAEKDATTKK